MTIEPGWPCADLASAPPSVADRLSAPTADELLPQVLALAPRGPAWGTDEAGDGQGASPRMRQVWTALAGWAGDLYAAAFDTAVQAFPSAISFSLADWEAEYGLPDACVAAMPGSVARVNALRMKFGATGGASPAYFVCLAASIGYDITIEEPTQFLCDASECDGDDQVSDENVHHYWVVRVGDRPLTWFRVDEGECDADPLEGFIPAADLECLLSRHAPTHTSLIFNYSSLWTADSAMAIDTPLASADGRLAA